MVADPGGDNPNPDPTYKKKNPDPNLTLEKYPGSIAMGFIYFKNSQRF